MKGFIFLFIFGCVNGLQSPIEYKYDYRGVIGTAIPDLRPQVAAALFKCKVTVSMENAETAIVKLSDIVVAEKNDDLDVNIRNPVLFFERDTIKNSTQLLEPFKVNFNAAKGSAVMEVPETDILWMTNLRKSIVELLRVSTKGDHQVKLDLEETKYKIDSIQPIVFSLTEDTLIGNCEAHYSLVSFPTWQKQLETEFLDTIIKNDVQRNETQGVPKLSYNSLYRLTRNINSESCPDEVVFQNAGIGRTNQYGFNQFETAASKSYYTSQVLRGAPGEFRLDATVSESIVRIRPFGLESEEIHTISNQTLFLTDVAPLKEVPPVSNLKPVYTWKFEVVSPYSSANNTKTWVHFRDEELTSPSIAPELITTGINLTSSDFEQYESVVYIMMEEILSSISSAPKPPQAANATEGSTTGMITENIHLMTEIISRLPEENIKNIHSNFTSRSGDNQTLVTDLFYDSLAASGSPSSIKVLMENIQNMSDARATAIFLTIANNNKIPKSILEYIWPVVSKLDINSQPLLAATASMNIGQLSRHQCVRKLGKAYTVPIPILGNQDCSEADIEPKLFHVFMEKLETAEKPWEQVVFIKSLANLGLAKTVKLLKPYIEGHKTKNVAVRIAAVMGLHKYDLPRSVKQEVFDILMARISNKDEEPEVRQISARILLTWSPDAAWYQDLCSMTWKEPNKNMAAFLTRIVKNISKLNNPRFKWQKRIATAAYPRCKPDMGSYRYSYEYTLSEYLEDLRIGGTLYLGYINGNRSSIPPLMYGFLRSEFGSFRSALFEGAVTLEGVQEGLFKIINGFQHDFQMDPGASIPKYAKEAANIMKNYMDNLSPNLVSSPEPNIGLTLKMFENMQIHLPINKEMISKIVGGPEEIKKFLTEPTEIHATKFVNPVSINTVLASEVNGFPILIKFEALALQIAEGKVRAEIPGRTEPTYDDLLDAKHLKIHTDIDYRFSVKIKSSMKAIIPWSKRSVVAKVDNEKSLNLPLKGEFTFSRHDDYDQTNFGSWNISMTVEPKYPEQIPVIYAQNIPTTSLESWIPGQGSILDNIQIIHKDYFEKTYVKVYEEYEDGFLGLQGHYKWIGDVDNIIDSGYTTRALLKRPQYLLSALTSPVSALWKAELSTSTTGPQIIKLQLSNQMSRYQLPVYAVPDTDVSLTAYLETKDESNGNSSHRYYAMTARYSSIPDDKTQQSVIQLNGVQGPTPTEEQEKMVCNVMNIESPKVHTIEEFISALDSSIASDIMANVTYGKDCIQGREIIAMKGSIEVTEKRRQEITEEMKELDLPMDDPTVMFPIAVVYDHIKTRWTWMDNIPHSILNVTFNIDHFMKGLAFPFVQTNSLNVTYEPHVVEISGTRPLYASDWKIWMRTPSEVSKFDHVKFPKLTNGFIRSIEVKGPLSEIAPLLAQTLQYQCIIEANKIVTFDKHIYKETLPDGYTVAATDSTKINNWKLLVKNEDGMTARLVVGKSTVDINQNEIMIEGRKIKPRNILFPYGAVLIAKEGDSIILEMPYEISIKLSKRRIQLQINQKYHSKMAGICGNFNGQPENDLIAPNRCIYQNSNESKEFLQTWNIGKERWYSKTGFEKVCHKAPTLI